LEFQAQFACVIFALESLFKFLNSSFGVAKEVAHCLEEGRSSLFIDHLNKLHDFSLYK